LAAIAQLGNGFWDLSLHELVIYAKMHREESWFHTSWICYQIVNGHPHRKRKQKLEKFNALEIAKDKKPKSLDLKSFGGLFKNARD